MPLRLGTAVALAALLGCGKGPPKLVAVSGTVTCDAQPLAEGSISFKTVSTGAVETMPIKDGKFEGKAEPGERRVEVNEYRTKVLKDDPMGGEVRENLIADRFNVNSTLTATVAAPGPNAFAFEVKRK